jgi:CHAT domain-containing protein
VLAGCRTDDETEGRATLSLARAFVSAGASAVVGSLWNVDDEDTARIMTEFHQHLSNGVPPEQALCLTQRSAIGRRVPLSSWAAFQTQM